MSMSDISGGWDGVPFSETLKEVHPKCPQCLIWRPYSKHWV